MKQRILQIAKQAGMFRLAHALTGSSLRILGYHGLWTADGEPYGNTLFMPVDQFTRRMEWLACSGYPVLDLGEAVDRLGHGTLPPHAVAITIDDGWRSTYTHMLPVLERLGLPSTLYVASYYSEHRGLVSNVALGCIVGRGKAGRITVDDILPGVGTIDVKAPDALKRLNMAVDALPTIEARTAAVETIGDRAGVPLAPFGEQFTYATPAELADAKRRGMRIELHTHRHRGLHAGVSALASEIDDNRAALGRACAGPFDHFCYPNGEYDAEAERILADRGIRSATTTARGLNPPGIHPYRLRRMLDSRTIGQLEFETYMTGGFEMIDRRRHLA